MYLHPSTFQFLTPSEQQIADMAKLREAAKAYADVVDAVLDNGPDKTAILRQHRTNAMWANVAVTREANGTPKES